MMKLRSTAFAVSAALASWMGIVMLGPAACSAPAPAAVKAEPDAGASSPPAETDAEADPVAPDAADAAPTPSPGTIFFSITDNDAGDTSHVYAIALDAKTFTPRRITSTPDMNDYLESVSPDGKMLAILRNDPKATGGGVQSIVVMGSDGSAESVLFACKGYCSSLNVGADGALWFLDQDPASSTVHNAITSIPAAGGATVQHDYGLDPGCEVDEITVSPDGKTLFVNVTDGTSLTCPPAQLGLYRAPLGAAKLGTAFTVPGGVAGGNLHLRGIRPSRTDARVFFRAQPESATTVGLYSIAYGGSDLRLEIANPGIGLTLSDTHLFSTTYKGGTANMIRYAIGGKDTDSTDSVFGPFTGAIDSLHFVP